MSYQQASSTRILVFIKLKLFPVSLPKARLGLPTRYLERFQWAVHRRSPILHVALVDRGALAQGERSSTIYLSTLPASMLSAGILLSV